MHSCLCDFCRHTYDICIEFLIFAPPVNVCVCVCVNVCSLSRFSRHSVFGLLFSAAEWTCVWPNVEPVEKIFFWGGKEGCDPAELWVLHPIFSRTAAAWVELTPLKLSQEYWDHFVQFCHVISMCEHIKCNALCREFCILRLSNISIQFQTDMINSWLVFPFPDVYFYSREYGNDSSHSRAPGNDE